MDIINQTIDHIQNYIHGNVASHHVTTSDNAKLTRMNYFPPPPKRCPNPNYDINHQSTDGINGQPPAIEGADVVKNSFFLGFTLLCPPFLIGYAVTAACINLYLGVKDYLGDNGDKLSDQNEVGTQQPHPTNLQSQLDPQSPSYKVSFYLSGKPENGVLTKIPEEGETGWHLLGKTNDLQGQQVEEALKILINDPKAIIAEELTRPNNDGYSPLHLAAQNNNLAFFTTLFPPLQDKSILTENNIDLSSNTGNDNKVKTPVHILVENLTTPAQRKKKEDLDDRVGLILYCIASNAPELLLQKDEDGLTPLEFANNLINQEKEIPSEILYYLEHPHTVKELAEAKSKETKEKFDTDEQYRQLSEKLGSLETEQPNQNNSDQIEAIQKEADAILEKYTPISVKDYTPLSFQIKNGKKKEQYPNGNNHMHDIASNSQDINTLLSWIGKSEQANLNSPNDNGKTPLHLAIENGNINFIEIACDPTIRYNLINWNDQAYKDLKPINLVLDKPIEASTAEEIDKFSRIAYLVVVKNSDSIDQTVLDKLDNLIKSCMDDNKKAVLQKLKNILEKSNLFLEARLEKSSAAQLHTLAVKQNNEIKNRLATLQKKS